MLDRFNYWFLKKWGDRYSNEQIDFFFHFRGIMIAIMNMRFWVLVLPGSFNLFIWLPIRFLFEGHIVPSLEMGILSNCLLTLRLSTVSEYFLMQGILGCFCCAIWKGLFIQGILVISVKNSIYKRRSESLPSSFLPEYYCFLEARTQNGFT